MGEFQNKLSNLTLEEINKLRNNEFIQMVIGDNQYDVDITMVDLRIEAKEGCTVGMENNNYVILNTTLTNELLDEGLAREFVSKVQQIRKNKDFDIADRITIQYEAGQEVTNALTNYEDYIKKETLAVSIMKGTNLEEKIDLNDYPVSLTITKK